MNALILGGTGLLGKAFLLHSTDFGYKPVTLARKGADINTDATVKGNLYSAIDSVNPSLIINAIAQLIFNLAKILPNLLFLLIHIYQS